MASGRPCGRHSDRTDETRAGGECGREAVEFRRIEHFPLSVDEQFVVMVGDGVGQTMRAPFAADGGRVVEDVAQPEGGAGAEATGGGEGGAELAAGAEE